MATKKQTEQKPLGSAFDLLDKSLQIVKRNWQTFAIVNIFTIFGAIFQITRPEHTRRDFESFKNMDWSNFNLGQISSNDFGRLAAISGLLLLAFLIIGIFFTLMSVCLETQAARGDKTVSFDTAFAGAKKYGWRLIGLFIVMAIIIALGFVLLIIPGFIAIHRLIFTPYVMIDQNLSIGESIQKSREMASQNKGPVWAVIGVAVLVSIVASIVGAFPIVGPLVSAGITIAYSLIIALRYFEIKKRIPHTTPVNPIKK